jgi:hypothetical protein
MMSTSRAKTAARAPIPIDAPARAAAARVELKPAKDLSLAELADEYSETRGRMQRWKPAINPDAQRFAELAAEMLTRCAAAPAAKSCVVEGATWLVPVTACQRSRVVKNVEGLVRKLGLKRIAELWTPGLGLIEKEIPQDQHGKYISESQSGRRVILEPVPRQLRAA